MSIATVAVTTTRKAPFTTNAMKMNLPQRQGTKPRTTSRLPHSQLDQHGSDDVVKKLHQWCFSSLPHVENQPSGISVPGARALVLQENLPSSSSTSSSCSCCNPNAFMVGREFAHIHPAPDNGSMHVQLPASEAKEVVEAGWGEDHYLVTQGHYPPGLIMVFSPRTDDELETVKKIVTHSYEFATGKSMEK